jgi:hypothetical protein
MAAKIDVMPLFYGLMKYNLCSPGTRLNQSDRLLQSLFFSTENVESIVFFLTYLYPHNFFLWT